MLLDFTTEFGRRAEQQLETEVVVWLTTVGSDGTPQPRPVWFYWDGTSILLYSRPDTYKVRHLARNPQVSVHFSSDWEAHHITVLTGVARVDPTAPPADQNREYLEKYGDLIAGLSMTPQKFAQEYSVPIRITARRLRGF